MTTADHEDGGPLIDGLASLPPGSFESPGPGRDFEDALLARALGAVRSRGRWRRARGAAALLLVFAMGFGSSELLRVRVAAPSRVEPVESPVTSVAAVQQDPAAILRSVRSAVPADRSRLLRMAGDEYLIAAGNLEGALHCYRQFFEIASEDERTRLEPGDTWLLASLKQEKIKNR